MRARLGGKVAVVTGASRGLGKGIALGLGEAGMTVYVTGRSTSESGSALPGTINATADEVTRLGGIGVAVRCDHRVDSEVEALFGQIRGEQGRVDLLVNNAFATPAQRLLWGGQPFWELPLSLWDDIHEVGLRSHFVAARYAVPIMLGRKDGLVINVSSHAAGHPKSATSKMTLPYSVGKAALHRLTQDMATELHQTGVSVISIWPPATRTEAVLAEHDVWGDLSDWRPPLFTGRVVAAFVADGDAAASSGEALDIEELAGRFGVVEPTNA